MVGVPRDLAEELGLADSHRYLGGDCLQQSYVIGTEAPAVSAAGPQLAPHHPLVHHRHRQLAVLVQPAKQRLVGGVNVVIVEGVDVRESLPEQVGDIPVVGERVLLICGPALFAWPQVTDIDHGVQHAALAFPAADGKRGRVQRCQGLLGDYLECVVETVGSQHGLGHLQHRTQCPHVIARHGVKQVGGHGLLAAGDGFLYTHWRLSGASAELRSSSLRPMETPRTITSLPSPAVELYRPRAHASARWKSLPRPSVTTRGRKDVDLPCDATEAQQRRSPPSHGAGLGPSWSTCRGSADASWPPRSPLLGCRPVPQVGCAAAVEAQPVSLTSWSASPTGPARSAVTAERPRVLRSTGRPAARLWPADASPDMLCAKLTTAELVQPGDRQRQTRQERQPPRVTHRAREPAEH